MYVTALEVVSVHGDLGKDRALALQLWQVSTVVRATPHLGVSSTFAGRVGRKGVTVTVLFFLTKLPV